MCLVFYKNYIVINLICELLKQHDGQTANQQRYNGYIMGWLANTDNWHCNMTALGSSVCKEIFHCLHYYHLLHIHTYSSEIFTFLIIISSTMKLMTEAHTLQ